MKTRKSKRILTMSLAICLILTTSALASVIGTLIDGYDVYLGAGMELSKGVYWTGSDYRTENYIEYSPSSSVYPVVVSGSKVSNYGNFSSMSGLMENQGKHVIAGINGDYYVVSTNVPLGIVVEDGVLRTSSDTNYAVGFRADGSTIFGKPAQTIAVSLGGQDFTMDAFNKTRSSGGAVVLSSDFGATTKNSGSGIDVVCSMNGTPAVSGTVNLTVDDVVESSGAMSIPAGKAIISVSDGATEGLKNAVNALNPGDAVTLKISCAPGWENVRYAIGSLYKLVTNGKVESGLTTDVNPRSAVGMKADGTVVFYTIDGRQTGHSVGVTMKQLSERMIELGCTEATIMDGGGSTSLNAIYIGDSSASQINKPSEGTQRSVSNYIMLVTDKKPTGVADRLALYPLSTNILSGAKTAFTLKAADANGYSASINTQVELTVTNNLGTISADGTFVAAGAGRGSIVAEGRGLVSAATEINVVKTPDILRVFKEGTSTQVTTLNLSTDSITQLKAQAMSNYVYLTSQDNCYTWSVVGDIGTIDGEGNFTAAHKTASGEIRVAAGEKTVTIPVTVTSPERFDDVIPEAWYYNAVNTVCEKGLMDGVGGRTFAPDGNVSRAMAVMVLYRMSGSPAAEFSPQFSDVKQGQWYANAISWASANSVVEGYGSYFDPDGSVTREQLATMLYRYYGSPAASGDLSGFTDAGTVSIWARNGVTWAAGTGIIGGVTATQLSPTSFASRAQLAIILSRLAA